MLVERWFFTEMEAQYAATTNGGSCSLVPDHNPPWRAVWSVPDPEPVVEVKPEPKPKIRRVKVEDDE